MTVLKLVQDYENKKNKLKESLLFKLHKIVKKNLGIIEDCEEGVKVLQEEMSTAVVNKEEAESIIREVV